MNTFVRFPNLGRFSACIIITGYLFQDCLLLKTCQFMGARILGFSSQLYLKIILIFRMYVFTKKFKL